MPRSSIDFRFRRVLGVLRRCVLASPVLTLSALLLGVSLLFMLAPRIDFAVSGLFYDPAAGFGGRRAAMVSLLRDAGWLLEWAFALALILPFAIKLLAPDSRLLVRPRASLFALTALAVGPGLLVNGVLKEFWGRARPREVIEFGGGADFSPVWWISGECERNCSFVSGEAASAFWLVSLAFIVPKAWRPVTAIVTLAAAAAVSATRIAVGGHFISDVLIAWLLTVLVIVLLQRLILKGLPENFDPAVEIGIGRAGRVVRRWLSAGTALLLG
jgi:membrane-associated phospholipid phosphatase